MRKYPVERGSVGMGRIVLIVIFVVFRVVDLLTILSVPLERREHILGSMFVSLLWTTVFLIAIWMGQNWARYVLATLLAISIFFLAVFIPDILSNGGSLPFILPVSGLVNLIVIIVLIYLPSLQLMTKRR